MLRLASIILVAFMVPSLALADGEYDLSGRWGLGLGAGKSSVENADFYQANFDGDFIGSLWLRYHFGTYWATELDYTNLSFKKDGANQTLDMKGYQFNLSIAFRAWATQRLRFLIQMGVGAGELNTDVSQNTDFDLKGKLGLEFMLSPDWALGLHGDYNYFNVGSGTDSEVHTLAPMLAITYYFGSSEEPDSDGDGIPDSKDKCPNQGGNVDATGCPVKADSDGDGVPDDLDRCPNTPKGQQVTPYGCAKEEKLEISLDVRFKISKAEIDSSFVDDLTKFGEFMNKYPKTETTIEGHTDSTGTRAYNLQLSKKRAQAVVDYLSSNFGIDKKRLKAVGYGPDQPIADNKTKEGRGKNRRVVANVKN